MMRTVEDLRRAMIAETEELAPAVTLAAVRERARRRGAGYTAAGAALMVLATLTGVMLTVGPRLGATGSPDVSASADPSASGISPIPGPPGGVRTFPPTQIPPGGIHVHPSFPPVGSIIDTGSRIGTDGELVAYFTVGSQFFSGKYNRATRQFIPYESYVYTAPSGTQGFRSLSQVDAGDGWVIDYGVYVGPVATMGVDIGGRHLPIQFARWSQDPSYVVFWIERTGTPVVTDTNYFNPPPVEIQPLVFAYDTAGKVVTTSAGIPSEQVHLWPPGSY